MVDTGAYTSWAFNILSTGLFWVVLIFGLIIIAFIFLAIRKGRKLSVKVIEQTPIGRGKMSIRFGKKHKGGWFKQHTTFFGLWDYGQEEIFKLKDGRRVYGVSSEDFHDINGQPGLVVCRSAQDPRILVPLNKMELKGKEVLETVAPVELRTSAVDIIKKAEKETVDKTERIMQWIFWGGIIIFSFIAIMLITKMVSDGQSESKELMLQTQEQGKELLLQAGQITKDNIRTICEGVDWSAPNIGESVASGVAP